MLDTLDTSLPQVSVQFRVKSDISGAHVLGGELSDLLDGLWGSLVELDTVQLFVSNVRERSRRQRRAERGVKKGNKRKMKESDMKESDMKEKDGMKKKKGKGTNP